MEAVSAKEAVKVISSENQVFIQGGVATPQALVNAMAARSGEFSNVEILHIHTEGKATYLDSDKSDSFIVNLFWLNI